MTDSSNAKKSKTGTSGLPLWHDRDEFWKATEPILFRRERLEGTAAEVDKIITLLKLEQELRILDLCCGIGRHSLELARRGFIITGVDRTRPYLNKAIKQAKRERLEIEFIEDDMRKFVRPNAFNIVINLFTSFSYFEDPDEDFQVLKNVYRSLKKGGLFLIEMMGKEVLARIFLERGWYRADDYIVLEERWITRNWTWMVNRWTVIKGNRRTELDVSHRIYSAAELTALLQKAGFVRCEVYGDLEGSDYDHTAKRLVVVARK